MREGVALFDQSSFGKFRLEGRDAVTVLNRVCANNVDVAAGRVVYTQWLNDRGGIEADLTVTRLSETAFMIVGGAETEVRDFYWLKRQIPDDAHCVLTNVTSSMGVLSIMGPKSRDLLQSLTPADMSHAGFPFATSREIELGYAMVRAWRITFVGLGWELYVPTGLCSMCMTVLWRRARQLGLRTRATMRSTRCAWRRPTGTGATTSPTRIRRWRPGLVL